MKGTEEGEFTQSAAATSADQEGEASLSHHLYSMEIWRILTTWIQILDLEKFALRHDDAFRQDLASVEVHDAVKRARFYREPWNVVLNEIVFCRIMDLLEKYVKDALIEVGVQNKYTMISEKMVSFKEVLLHDTMDSLALSLAIKRVEALSFAGYDKLVAELVRLGVDPKSTTDEELVRDLFQVRHVVVHRNRLASNEPNAYEQEWAKREIDKRLGVTTKDPFTNLVSFCVQYVSHWDAAICAKFSIAHSRSNPKGK